MRKSDQRLRQLHKMNILFVPSSFISLKQTNWQWK